MNRRFLLFLTSATVMAGGVYYTHLEEVPVTGRKRFNLFTPQMIEQLAEEGARHLLSESLGKLLPEDHPDHKRVEQICRQLARGASSLPELHAAEQVSRPTTLEATCSQVCPVPFDLSTAPSSV